MRMTNSSDKSFRENRYKPFIFITLFPKIVFFYETMGGKMWYNRPIHR